MTTMLLDRRKVFVTATLAAGLLVGVAVSGAPRADEPAGAEKQDGPESSGAHLLEFRIVADRAHDGAIAEQALGPDGLKKPPAGYRWVRLEDREGDGHYRGAIVREEGRAPDAVRKSLLVKLDPYNVNENDLARVYKVDDERHFPAIGIGFKPDGARRFGDLTRTHLPEDNGRIKYQLAIIVEGAAISSPLINSEVRDGAIIDFGGKEPLPAAVDRLIKRLEEALTPAPEPAKD